MSEKPSDENAAYSLASREAVRIAFRNLFSGWLVSPVCSLTLVALFWGDGRNARLAGWMFASVAIPALRLISHVKFNNVRDGDFDPTKWERVFLIGSAVSGVLWGSAAIFIFPDGSVANQNFLLLLIAGLSAGASMSYSSLKWGAVSFALPAFLPNIIKLFSLGDSMHNSMALVATAFSLAVYGTSKNAFSLVTESLRLRFENLELIAGLHEARDRQATHIEELKKAKEVAEEATKLKDRFISIISHDLKGPLSSIRGLMNISVEYRASAEEMRKYARVSQGVADGLLEMLEQLLDISRLSTGQMLPQVSDFPAWGSAEAAIQKLKTSADDKGISLVNDIPHNLLLLGDRHLVGQVLLNLIGNAIKFTNRGGVVVVFLAGPRTIGVRDTGVGIKDSILPNLFRHDIKTTGMGTNGETGTGLGLPYCMDVMLAHGGGIRVETGPAGTVFYLDFAVEIPLSGADDKKSGKNV